MRSKVFDLIAAEEERQNSTVELIASENFVSDNVLTALGSCLTNKYTEGYPQRRYYGGCQWYDELETYCQDKWREVFGTDYHVNVQPHSGSNANMAAYMAVLKQGDTVLSMSLEDGGHLTHGSTVNFSGKLYDFHHYGTTAEGYIDYADLRTKALRLRPRLIVAGASAYPREIDFDIIGAIADEVGALMMVDMSHIAGLVATGYHNSPFGIADIITTTTHKTLRGARGGLIFCKPEYAKAVDSAVFPGTQGGALQNVIAAKAVTAEEALTAEYREYIGRVVSNARCMAQEFMHMGYEVVTGGTGNHLLLIDFTRTHPDLTGMAAQELLDRHGITVNKNCVPHETRSPQQTSGIRIGTAAMTTKGYTAEDFVTVVHRVDEILRTDHFAETGNMATFS